MPHSAPSQVESLPFLGRTWYRRGSAYWLRRALATLLMVVALVVCSLITYGVGQAVATAHIGVWARVIILIAAAAAVARSIVKAWTAFDVANRQARRQGVATTMAEAAGERRRGARERQRRAIGGSATLGALAGAGSSALLVISVVFNFGWAVVALLASCQKYLSPEEFAAWQKIKQSHAR
jgi:hypothetical protein